MALILTVVLVSLAGSFVCSICEAALYAVTPTRVEVLRQRGVAGSRKLGELRERVDALIAAMRPCRLAFFAKATFLRNWMGPVRCMAHAGRVRP